ncbi:CMGC/CLK protein kinase [Fusarium oxysporum f. sp. melonis 26406]|uniref:CMGC/CLK protein kinase n=1 Tax=Fusarium oxysporum f. sp. melonis 26406 TaxID=1089452 RepID=W9Z4K7_FUSOX|nr:CMGC/CLK protein kinase [Fusarium oxysporum f. sp. melonis 26406]
MRAPADAQNRVLERPRVLCTDKTSIPPPERAGEVDVKFIPDKDHDEDDGSYKVTPNTKLTEQFEVLDSLGEGGFAKVVRARQIAKHKLVAIKISALGKECSDAARNEIRILKTIKMHDKKNENRCIHAQMCFEYRGHICMVMKLLAQSTHDFLKENNLDPFPDSQIQSFAKQLFGSVAFLHDLGIVHGDIKPDNVLLCKKSCCIFSGKPLKPSSYGARSEQGQYATKRRILKDTEVRLADFGLATFLDESPSYFLTTPQFSAPETWLYRRASFSHDIWSIGCTLVEFFTGHLLFNTRNMLEYLAMIEAFTGLKVEEEIPCMVDEKSRGRVSALLHDGMQEPRQKVESMKMKHLDQIIPRRSNAFRKNFADLLKRIFVFNPDHRITAKQALQHPCLIGVVQRDEGTVAAGFNRASGSAKS